MTVQTSDFEKAVVVEKWSGSGNVPRFPFCSVLVIPCSVMYNSQEDTFVGPVAREGLRDFVVFCKGYDRCPTYSCTADGSTLIHGNLISSHDGVLGHVRDELLTMMLEEFSAGRLELNLALDLSHLAFIGVAVCSTRINHDPVSGRTSLQSK